MSAAAHIIAQKAPKPLASALVGVWYRVTTPSQSRGPLFDDLNTNPGDLIPPSDATARPSACYIHLEPSKGVTLRY
jgi:hypothetical protein